MGITAQVEPERILNYQFSKVNFSYTERDAALYALGVGAPADPAELRYVYHPEGQAHISVLPTLSALFTNYGAVFAIDGLKIDPKLLLHGEQYIEIYKPLPASCQVECQTRISGLQDKGKAAVLELETLSCNKATGDVLCLNRNTIFLGGAGGFSSSSKERFAYSNRTQKFNLTTAPKIPTSVPEHVHKEYVGTSQALLYRLSGDYNPLHADEDFAKAAGFERPILHGLCTYGYAVRAVIRFCCDGDPSKIQTIQGRFVSHVYPGSTLVTEIWRDNSKTRVTYRCSVEDKTVLLGSIGLNLSFAKL